MLSIQTLALGLSSRSPFPYFHVPESNSRYCLEVTPGRDGESASLRCMRFDWDGPIHKTQIWKLDGEYSYPGELFLAPDGRSMARLRFPDFSTPRGVLAKWVFIEFFRDGKPITNMKLGEVVDVEKLNLSSYFTVGYEILEVDIKKQVQVLSGSSSACNVGLPQDTRIATDDGLLVIHTRQSRSLYFRLSDGKLVLSREGE